MSASTGNTMLALTPAARAIIKTALELSGSLSDSFYAGLDANLYELGIKESGMAEEMIDTIHDAVQLQLVALRVEFNVTPPPEG